MKTFPDKSSFNVELSDSECEGYSDGIQELRKIGWISLIDVLFLNLFIF